MSKPLIVIPDGMDQTLFEELQKESGLEIHNSKKVSRDQLKVLMPKVHGLIIRSATTVDKELIDLAPNLKLVIRAGEGTDNIDKKYCAQKDIKVANTPGANGNSAAEQAIALMFAVLRKSAWAHASMARGEWEKNAFTGLEMWKKTIGVVGFGRIGQTVAQRLSGFEPKVLFYDPFIQNSNLPYAQKADLQTIFKQADIITIHTPLMPETKNMVNKDLLGLMKKRAILINAARGGIVHEGDLMAILKEGKIAGAGLDVFEKEPLAADSAWRSMNNVVLAPHLGASTEEAQERVGEMAVHQIKQFFLHKQLLHEVK
jgi:D-3-phosphoglycerate dehydrogenase